MSEIRAIESNKHPVYTFQGKDKTLELPMEITDKGKLVSVIVNGSKTVFNYQMKIVNSLSLRKVY